MKKILAFLALASLSQLAAAVDYDTVGAITSGTVVSSPTAPTVAANTCTVLSNAEPAVTINLSRDVVAAMHCNTTANAVGAATQHPGGRPAACTTRCAYMATTSGGPVTAVTSPGGSTPPTAGTTLTTCATTISGHTGGTAPTACQ